RCAYSFRDKHTDLDNHMQRGDTGQLFYNHRDFVVNIASFVHTSRLDCEPTADYECTVVNNDKVKHGDSIKLAIPQELIDDINNNGSSSFKGKKTYTIEANALPELNKLENISETLDRNNKLIKDEYNSSKYTKYKTENIDNYYKVDYD